MKTRRILPLAVPLALGLSPAMAQTRARPVDLSLGEAVTQVRQETQGQVLSAESMRRDRRTEYRVKVLTPQGHVKVVTISANTEPGAPSNRNPSGRHAGMKEKH
ncbi:MAG: hypothetical protein RSP_05820 [Rhodanobacter sp.]